MYPVSTLYRVPKTTIARQPHQPFTPFRSCVRERVKLPPLLHSIYPTLTPPPLYHLWKALCTPCTMQATHNGDRRGRHGGASQRTIRTVLTPNTRAGTAIAPGRSSRRSLARATQPIAPPHHQHRRQHRRRHRCRWQTARLSCLTAGTHQKEHAPT